MKRYIIMLSGLCYLFWGCSDNQERSVIQTDQAPAAVGPYSQAIRANDALYLAGQIAIDPATGQMVAGGIEMQTHQVLKNVHAVLEEAGFGFEDVVQVQIFLTNLNNYTVVNKIYSDYFRESPPARAVVEVVRLPKNALIEILVTASKN
jgi:2-iminobutanoate/2-iminopropanoate deaminase